MALLLLICVSTNRRETFLIDSQNTLLVPNDRVSRLSKNFIHALEYYYRSLDIVLNDDTRKYVIGGLTHKHNYISRFLKRIETTMPELQIDASIPTEEEEATAHNEIVSDEYKYHNVDIDSQQLLGSTPELADTIASHGIDIQGMKLRILHWMTPRTARSIRTALCGPDEYRDIPVVGIINRKHNRKLLNINSIKYEIDALGLTVDEIFFESADFDEQIAFNNTHDIIVAPHGANLSSTPFIPDYGLVIEICNPEWTPYNYFTGLSVSSGKSHYLICDDHPATREGSGEVAQRKLDIHGNPRQITGCIEEFMIHRDRMYQEQTPENIVLKLL